MSQIYLFSCAVDQKVVYMVTHWTDAMEKYLDRKDRTMSYKFTYRNVRDITVKQTFLTKKKRKTSKLPGQLRNLMVNLKCNEIFSQVKPGFPFSPMNN